MCTCSVFRDAAAARQDVHVYIPLPGRLPPRLPARTRVRLLTRRARCVVEKVRCCQQISNASTFAHIFGECVYFYANCLLKCFAYFPIRFSVVLIGLLAFFTSSRYNFFFFFGGGKRFVNIFFFLFYLLCHSGNWTYQFVFFKFSFWFKAVCVLFRKTWVTLKFCGWSPIVFT